MLHPTTCETTIARRNHQPNNFTHVRHVQFLDSLQTKSRYSSDKRYAHRGKHHIQTMPILDHTALKKTQSTHGRHTVVPTNVGTTVRVHALTLLFYIAIHIPLTIAYTSMRNHSGIKSSMLE